MISTRRILDSLAVLLIAVSPVFSQVARGTIVGTVSDATGAIIPGVQVTVINMGTNQTRQAITNERGNYEVDLLPIGEYRATAELRGFSTQRRENIALSVGDRLRIDFQLTVGEITDRVDVSTEAPLVQTEDASMSAVMDRQKIVELPLNGRDFTKLAYLIPGAFVPRQNSSLGNRGGFTVAGVVEKENQIMVDGINNNGGGTHELSTLIIIDAIAEFRIQTNTYGAQYGTFAGGQVDAVTKSGTNQFHGNTFYFHRNDNMDARNFFDPWPLKNLPEFRRHQYGATLGGPIKKDKVFFFYAYEGQRQVRFQTATGTLPRPEFWEGDFSALLTAARPIQLRDPLTQAPFSGNIIPKNRLNWRSLKFREFVPDPNLPGVTQNAINSAIDDHDHRNQHAIKLDYQIDSNHTLSFSYNNSRSNLSEWAVFAGRPFLDQVRGFASRRLGWISSLNWTWAISNRVVNDVRGGMNRLLVLRPPAKYGDRYFNDEIQIYGTMADRFPQFRGIPDVVTAGYETIGTGGTQFNYNQAYTFNDTISMALGNHNVKAGFLFYQKGQNTYFGPNRRGTFQFSGAFSGDSFADFLLGFPISTTRSIPGPGGCYIVNHGDDPCGIDFHPKIPSTNLFIQDDWKLSSRLTLNLGLRWEYNSTVWEKYGRMRTYDLTINDVRTGSSDRPLYPRDWNNFAPRIGLAYRFNDKTAVRAGFGVFYGVDNFFNNLYNINPPNFYNQVNTSSPTAITLTMDNPFPVPPEEQFKVRAGLSPYAVDPDFRTMYYQNWNLGVQRELPGNMLVETSYEGKVGHGLIRSVNINQARPGTSPLQSRRPLQPWGNLTVDESTGNSNYHAGTLKFEKRMASGISFLTSYAFSKMIDDGTNAQDELNRRAERGPSEFDTRHRLAMSYVFELPFGSDRRFGQGIQNPLIRGLIERWELSGIAVMRSGLPFTPTISGDNSGTGQSRDRPDQIADPRLPKSERTVQRYFRTEAFTQPTRGTFGNAGRNQLTGPGQLNLDVSVSKRVQLGEQKEMQIRIEFFNALNTPTFFLPNGTSNTSNFGRIFQAEDARQIQLGAKINF